MEAIEEKMRRGGSTALEEVEKFFARTDPVHTAVARIASRLDELEVPYAVAGGMALVAHGYNRTTTNGNILLTPDGLKKVHEASDGLEYLLPFTGSRHLRDTTMGVRVEFLVTGGFPGDGKPKPVVFPDPATVGVEIRGITYLALNSVFELKLASGMTNAGRLKDLADVQELIRALQIPRELADQLNPYVRDKFVEMWDAVQDSPQE